MSKLPKGINVDRKEKHYGIMTLGQSTPGPIASFSKGGGEVQKSWTFFKGESGLFASNFGKLVVY